MPQIPKTINVPNKGKNFEVAPLVALGSNLAGTTDACKSRVSLAIKALEKRGYSVPLRSRYYRTPAFPAGAGPDFVNAAVVVQGVEDPQSFLADLHMIEADLGRTREKRWAARTLDLDWIAWGKHILPNRETLLHWMELAPNQQMQKAPETLILPHPRLQDRAFVLVPLADIAPQWVHPVLGKTVQQMLDALPEALKSEVVALE